MASNEVTGFDLNVVYGDLFEHEASNPGVSLAHCVSRDLKMGAGIAKLFRAKFGRIQDLEKAKADIGEVAVLQLAPGDKFTYNLVTKAKFWHKPTYEHLRMSLVAMKKHAIEHSVKHIAMPKIGCGLDKLDWNAVRTLIKNVFLDSDIKISVYHLDQAAQPQASKQAYVPPAARGKLASGKYTATKKPTGLHDEDELPENLKGKKNESENLSKSAAKNKKRREAAAKKKKEESPITAQNVQAEEEAVNNTSKSTGDPEKDKKIRKINEKLTQINKLKEQAKSGKQLEANQLDKIKKEAEFLAELKMLKV